MKHPTPYQRIVRAAKARRGVRLTAEEVREMSNDDAISKLASNDDEAERHGCESADLRDCGPCDGMVGPKSIAACHFGRCPFKAATK